MKLINATQNRSYLHTCKPPLRYITYKFQNGLRIRIHKIRIYELFMIKKKTLKKLYYIITHIHEKYIYL